MTNRAATLLRGIVAALLFPAASFAANSVVLCSMNSTQGSVRASVGDTESGLPTTGVRAGCMAFPKDSSELQCFDGSAWNPCNSGSGGGAPTTVDYLVKTASGSLSAERVVTDTAEIAADFATPGQAKFNLVDDSIHVARLATSDSPSTGECVKVGSGGEFDYDTCGSGGLSDGNYGDVTVGGSGTTLTINANAVALGTDSTGNYAAGDAEAGNATGLACSTCVDATDLATGAVTSAKILDGTVAAADLAQSAKRIPSFTHQPASSNANDDEFDSTTLSGSWTVSATSGNSTSSGSISIIASPSSPVYDLTTVPDWLMWQSDTAGSGVAFTRSWSEDTTSMWMARCALDARNFSALQEGSVHIGLTNSGDNNESVFVWANTTGSALVFRVQVQNNGSFTEAASSNLPETQPLAPFYLLLVRNSNAYYGFVGFEGAPVLSYLGTVTKTGVTTFDQFRIVFLGANETPSTIMGCDYVRFDPGTTFPVFSR